MLEVENPVDYLSHCIEHNAYHRLHLLAISLIYLKSKLSFMCNGELEIVGIYKFSSFVYFSPFYFLIFEDINFSHILYIYN